jgi:hypothetical protein
VNYYQRNKLTKLLRFSCDIRDKDGLIIHHKGEEVPPRERIKKWGPGTNYEIVEAAKETQKNTRKVSDNANLLFLPAKKIKKATETSATVSACCSTNHPLFSR